VPKNKSKMISIRVSDQDYCEIKSRCDEHGAINVSEFVRAATVHALGLPELPSFSAFTGLKLAALEKRFERLATQVNTLAKRAGAVFPRSD
jgi:hypothetical protein